MLVLEIPKRLTLNIIGRRFSLKETKDFVIPILHLSTFNALIYHIYIS